MVKVDAAELSKIYSRLQNLGIQLKVSEIRKILKPAAQLVIDEAKNNVSQSKKPHTRYVNGQKTAVYYPGNLRRSLQILANIGKLSGNVIAGPRRFKGDPSGTFKGRRVDGYYAAIVEKKNPYLRPAFDSKKGEAESVIIEGLKNKINSAIR